MTNRRAQGAEHEDRAAQYLLQLGYTIVTRRFRTKGGEIDIVAVDGETLVFVEVKFRSQGAPEDTLGHTKEHRFSDAVEGYLQKTGLHLAQIRFDLIAVTPDEIRHYKGAFRVV